MGQLRRQQRVAIAAKLLGWFDEFQRQMPWRNTRDPYAIWVSEIMLQQTQVKTVIPYYEGFMASFPTVNALAAAPEDRVLKHWEGLGYYSRARNLHKAAKLLVTDYNATLPDSAEGLQALPGIGRYTAGAIASIAFGLSEPVLDGNVMRVLTRLRNIDAPLEETSTQELLWTLASSLIPAGKAGDFNQAMMELGATICRPRKPACGICPISPHCLARRAGCQEQLPNKKRPAKVPHHTVVAGVIWKGRGKGRKVLIDKRPTGGMLGGLWEFPGGKVTKGETLPDALAREVLEEVGLTIAIGEEIDITRHAYSHFTITMHTFDCTLVSGRARAIEVADVKWVRADELGDYAFPKANHAMLAKLRSGR
jgi:A/G-specific adenine glycosylase